MLRSAGGKKVGAKSKSQFPMTVKAFFADADAFLARGDILLSRSPTFASRLIRMISGHFFSHAAVVFLLPQGLEHFAHTYVIESLFKGVGIGNLEAYVGGRNPIEEVGILRLEGRGFNRDFFKRANGTLLNEVNKPYDFSRLWSVAIASVFGVHRVVLRMRNSPNIYRRWYPRQFICSGFIQFGYYEAAKIDKISMDRVILINGLNNPTTDQMMGTTPEDLATSDKLKWKYVIRRGWVYEAADYAEAKKIILDAR